jgi:hypothetical protein
MAKNTVNVGTGQVLQWPRGCLLCLNEATETLFTPFTGWQEALAVPYCAACYERVRRFTNWKDSLFMISLLFGAIGGVIGIISIVVQEGWAELLHIGNTTMIVGAAFLMLFAAAYVILWLLQLPLRLIFRSRLAGPGVRTLKSKDPLVTRLKFVSAEYLQRFKEANALA